MRVSGGQGVSPKGPWGSSGTPTESQGVKGYAYRVPGGPGVGLQGPKGSRGRPTRSQGSMGVILLERYWNGLIRLSAKSLNG